MGFSRTGLMGLALVGMAAAGCQSSRFSRVDTPPPAPLPAAPSGQVTQNTLPPPDASQFPTAPGQTTEAEKQDMQVAAASAPAITKGSMSGVWTASVANQSCRIAMGLTKFGASYRAAPLRCPDQIATVKGWDVRGNQLVLLDENGVQVASLYSSGERRFNGQTSSGQGISLALGQ